MLKIGLKARVLQELKILLNSNEIKNVPIGRIKAYNNKGVCFVSYTFLVTMEKDIL